MKYGVFEFLLSLCRCVPQPGVVDTKHDSQLHRDVVMEAASELKTL